MLIAAGQTEEARETEGQTCLQGLTDSVHLALQRTLVTGMHSLSSLKVKEGGRYKWWLEVFSPVNYS